MEKKLLRAIAVTAVVLTLLMLAYTMTAAYDQTNRTGSTADRSQAQPTSNQSGTESQSAPVDAKLFPPQLAGMNLKSAVSGQEAIQSVSQLHGTNIQIKTAYVVSYQGNDGSNMTVWFSEGKDEKDAKDLFKAMDVKMPKSQAFQNYKDVTINGKQYKFVTGMGQDHYYWLNGKRVMWVAVGGKNSADVLKQVAPLY